MIRNFFKRKKNKPLPDSQESRQDETPEVPEPPFKTITPLPTAEELCGINPETMDTEEIRNHLKKLYKRHNEAAASLNKELRSEAEGMLDAIVECRTKYIDS